MPWVLNRILLSVLLIWAVATILFLAIHIVPGDPAQVLLTYGGAAPAPEAVEALREKLGLNEPLLRQYAGLMGGYLRGDLGRSMQDGAVLSAEVALRLPRTLELIAAGVLLAVVIALPAGVWAALHRGRLVDRIGGLLVSVSVSLPVFVVGTLLILAFAQINRWMPAGGYTPLAQDPLRHVSQLLLPALTVAVTMVSDLFRMTRASVLEVLGRDHVRTAHAKGLAPGLLLRRHVLHNAMIPVVTVIALNMGTLLGGTVLVEYVFNWPGLSGFLVSSVNARDYTAVLAVVMVISTLFILINLCADIATAMLDPRTTRA